MPHRRRSVLGALLICGLGGFSSLAVADEGELEWGIFGCEELRPGNVCEVAPETKVYVWAKASHGRVLSPRTSLTAAGSGRADGGRWWSYAVPAPATLGLRARGEHGVMTGPKLILRKADIEQSEAAYEAASKPSVDWKNKLALLRPLDPWSRGRTLFWLVRQYGQQHAQRYGWLKEVENDLIKTQGLRYQVRTRTLVARLLTFDERPYEARVMLEDLLPRVTAPALAVRLRLMRGFTADALGDYAQARRDYEYVRQWALRLPNVEMQRLAEIAARWLLDTYTLLGEHEQAILLARRIAQDAQRSPDRRLMNADALIWWFLVRDQQRFGSRSTGLGEVSSERIRSWVATGFAEDKNAPTEIGLNLALFDLRNGRLAEAKTWLDEVETRNPDARTLAWLQEARGYLELESGRPQRALTSFETLASHTLLPLRWAGEVGRGRALQALKRPKEALLAFEAADRLLLDWPGAPNFGRSYGGLVSTLYGPARSRVALLVESGAARRAFRTAREARIRNLHYTLQGSRFKTLLPAQQRQWVDGMRTYEKLRAQLIQLPEPETLRDKKRIEAQRLALSRKANSALQKIREVPGGARSSPPRAPEPGELMLLVHPGIASWYLFAASTKKVDVVKFAPRGMSVARLGSALQKAFRKIDARLASSRTVTVMAAQDARQLDVHAMKWRGRPLIARKTVTYALDIRGSGLRPSEDSRRALVVGDPSGDLPGSRAEHDKIRTRLIAQGWQVEGRLGLDSEGSLVHTRLADVDLFHFSGHAEPATSGFDGGLRLANQAFLTASDVLSQPRVPRVVVLAACKSAVDDRPEDVGPALGVAQAFLFNGSGWVLATRQNVSDAMAARLESKLYHTDVFTPATIAKILAELAHGAGKDASWRAFRILTP